jgi:hypothetical protein
MRLIVALAAAVAAVPALAQPVEPVVRDCSTHARGDLGRDWRSRAALAGPLALVGMRDGYRRGSVPPAPSGRAWPLKVLVVVEPRAVVTVTIGARSRRFAALGYNALRHRGESVPLSAGSTSVRFEACPRPNMPEPWNRGTQFPGYFLVSGGRCVGVEVRVEGTASVLRRNLRFGAARCGAIRP